ncbi:type IV pilin [Natranaeroarchaeum aerophilus]|uniref:Type IV pilin N-terminal domain-containing protein n=1 Tax=Natranaeroarchaeum aerophilus TaxID=2917711 RepID=A0AAE3K3E6_9EURY|nr:type IV pilin N-terminal domain-containing protein [Natranaeroarchaeum aerophilus]MCL9812577.1 type IV pilin N-terminal domain-containing protein [Natranaeroarchaeum aerophilus]
MDFKKLFETDGDERAVSPVIGVILMVAITVILAAVIGAFVIGIGDDQSTVPQASWDSNQDNQVDNGEDVEVEITHQTGATIDESNLAVTIDGDDADDWVTSTSSLSPFGDPVSAGSTYTITDDDDSGDNDLNEGETIRVVWTSDDGGDSSVLFDFEVQ